MLNTFESVWNINEYVVVASPERKVKCNTPCFRIQHGGVNVDIEWNR